MRVLHAAILAAIVAGTAYGLQRGSDRVAEAAPTVAAETYRLAANGEDTSCAVTRGARVSADLSWLSVDPHCTGLVPGIERVRYWRDGEDGSVAFSATGIDSIVTFGIADGVDYESFAPAAPLISLAAVD